MYRSPRSCSTVVPPLAQVHDTCRVSTLTRLQEPPVDDRREAPAILRTGCTPVSGKGNVTGWGVPKSKQRKLGRIGKWWSLGTSWPFFRRGRKGKRGMPRQVPLVVCIGRWIFCPCGLDGTINYWNGSDGHILAGSGPADQPDSRPMLCRP